MTDHNVEVSDDATGDILAGRTSWRFLDIEDLMKRCASVAGDSSSRTPGEDKVYMQGLCRKTLRRL